MALKCTKLDRSGRARIADFCHRLRRQTRVATRIPRRWRGPVRGGESAGKGPSEAGLLVVRHCRLIRDDQIVGRSNRILPRAGIVVLAETAAKPWHRADDIVQRNQVALRFESRQVFFRKLFGNVASHADDEHPMARLRHAVLF